MRTKKLTVLAVFAALALILFVLEAQVPAPVPIPGVKLGLSNVITVCALFLFGWREALGLLLVRVLLGSLLVGQLGALPYALGGGLLSLCGMCLLRRVLRDGQLWVASTIGAMLHNTGQLAVAVLLTATPALFSALPVLLLCGLVAGCFTGLCAQLVCSRLKHRIS